MFNEIEVIIGMDFDVFEVYYIYDMIKLIINICNWISILHYLTFWNVYLILDFKYNTVHDNLVFRKKNHFPIYKGTDNPLIDSDGLRTHIPKW